LQASRRSSRLADPARGSVSPAGDGSVAGLVAVLKPAVFVVVLMMWAAAFASLVWLYGAGRDNPTPTDLVVMTVLMVAPMIAGLQQALRRALRGLLRRR
jgi:hypothetical protein